LDAFEEGGWHQPDAIGFSPKVVPPRIETD